MSSANSFLPSTAYHASNARYTASQSPSNSTASSPSSSSSSTSSTFNIRSHCGQRQQQQQQQPLNDLNSTRPSTCSSSHCVSNQCVECTTILSTRPPSTRNYRLDESTISLPNSSHLAQNASYVSNHTDLASVVDEQQQTRILSMNIPVDEIDCQDNSNNTNHHHHPVQTHSSSSLNIIEIDEQTSALSGEQNEQLEVFVGFYRPGEYQRESIEDDDDDGSEMSHESVTQKKDEQSTRELISDGDEGNEDQDFIDEDFGPNQDDEQQDDELMNDDEQLPPVMIVEYHQNIVDNFENDLQQIDHDEPMIIHDEAMPAALIVHIDEDEDQGFSGQLNDDCQSSDDENANNHHHSSTLSLNHYGTGSNENKIDKSNSSSKSIRRRSYSDSQLHSNAYTIFLSLPSLSTYRTDSSNEFEKIEHIIIDDQPLTTTTTMSNFVTKKKDDEHTQSNEEFFSIRKKKRDNQSHLRSSDETMLINSGDPPLPATVDAAVRDVERHVMLWSDEYARRIADESSFRQIVQYFQLEIDPEEFLDPIVEPSRNELLLDYLQFRSENDISAAQLHENLLRFPEFSQRIHTRFFPFWPPRDVDLLPWLSQWIKQGALLVAIMNMDHHQSHTIPSWHHRIIYGVGPRGIHLMNPIQEQSPQQLYEQLTVDSITYVTRHDIVQRYTRGPMPLTPLATSNQNSPLFADTRWRTMNVLGQVVNVLREDRQMLENETRNIPYRPTVSHVRIPSICSSGILIFSIDNNALINAQDLPLRK